MTDIFKIIAVCTVTLIASLFLKQYKSEFSLVITLIGAVVISFFILEGFVNIKQELEAVLNGANIDLEVIEITIKSLGICFITSFAANYCKDFGHSSLSSKVELAGKITVVILTFPLIKKIVEIALELIE